MPVTACCGCPVTATAHVLAAASDPLALPTWLTAAGTLALALFAIVTAWYARQAFRNQAAEVSLLQQQAEADQTSRRRERAAMAFITTEFDRGLPDGPDVIIPRGASITATLHNSGRQPVYDTRIHWVDTRTVVQSGAETMLGTIAPRSQRDANRELPQGMTESLLIPVAYFRDAAGIRWTLLGDGELDEVDATFPAGAPLIATTALERSRKREQDAAGAATALVAVRGILAEAADSHPFGSRRHGFWRTPHLPGK
jgi:hypothetical protein